MGKSTISMAIFNSKQLVYQMVSITIPCSASAHSAESDRTAVPPHSCHPAKAKKRDEGDVGRDVLWKHAEMYIYYV